MSLRATAMAVVCVGLAASACASGAVTVPAGLPADALPGMRSEIAGVGAGALAGDALDPAGLERVLDEAGFLSGRERTFSGRGRHFSLAVTRVLVFESAEGAASYLAWLRAHPRDLLGTAESVDPLSIPGSPFLFLHTPGGCCPKDVPVYLSAWRRGSTVLSVRASGTQADRASVEALAMELDLAVGG